jgi:hypothetical protein
MGVIEIHGRVYHLFAIVISLVFFAPDGAADCSHGWSAAGKAGEA